MVLHQSSAYRLSNKLFCKQNHREKGEKKESVENEMKNKLCKKNFTTKTTFERDFHHTLVVSRQMVWRFQMTSTASAFTTDRNVLCLWQYGMRSTMLQECSVALVAYLNQSREKKTQSLSNHVTNTLT